MRWPPGRGLTVVAIVLVGLSVLVVAGRMLALPPAEPPVTATASTPTGTIRIVPLTGMPSEPPIPWSTVPAASSGKPAQLTGGGAGCGCRAAGMDGPPPRLACSPCKPPISVGDPRPRPGPIPGHDPGQVVVTLSTGRGAARPPACRHPRSSVRRTFATAAGSRGSGRCREGRPHPRQHPLHRSAVWRPTAGGVAAAADQPAAGLLDRDLARLVGLAAAYQNQIPQRRANPYGSHQAARIRWIPRWAAAMTSSRLSVARLASSWPLRSVHSVSTGFRSGAYDGELLDDQPGPLGTDPGAHRAAVGRQLSVTRVTLSQVRCTTGVREMPLRPGRPPRRAGGAPP